MYGTNDLSSSESDDEDPESCTQAINQLAAFRKKNQQVLDDLKVL